MQGVGLEVCARERTGVMEGAGTCGELCEHCLLPPGPSLAAAPAVSGHLSTSHQWPPAPSMAPACVGCAWDVPCPSLQPGWFAVCGQWLRAELPDSHPLPNPLPSSCGFSRVKVLQVVQSQRGCGEWSRQGMELAGSEWQRLAGQCLLPLSLCATPGAPPAAARAWISPRVVVGSLHYH